MKETIEKIKNNKALHVIGEIIYVLLFLLVILMLIVVVLQRVSDNSVTLGGFRLFTVATGSMVPEYEVGDVLISKEIEPSEIKVGDDIVYRGKEGSFKDRIVTHRVISIREEEGVKKFITQGIANTEEDPEIDESQIYGKVIYKFKTLSFIGQIAKNIYVFYFIIFIPIAIIIFRQIRNIFANNDEDEEEEKDIKTTDENKKLEDKSKDGDEKGKDE